MKLSQIYSNKRFKSIVFNDGLNIVLAKVTEKLNLNKDSHNLGKSTLITVIDFMLLKKIDKEHIFNKYEGRFSEYVFYLEILLNDGEFLTIKRAISNSSRVSFKKTKSTAMLLDEKDWDETNVPFDLAVTKLNDYLKFDILNNWPYRKSVTYFLRSQKDYNDVFQLSKYSRGRDSEWKPFVFDLLGFDGTVLANKYAIEAQIAEQEIFVNKIRNQFSVDASEQDKIRGSIELKRVEQIEVQAEIDRFNFYQYERDISKELVEEVEARISELNSVEYNIEYDLDKTKKSFSQNISFDANQLRKIYEEVGIFLPDNLMKDYKDLEEFNRQITEERNKYLEEKIIKLNTQLEQTRKSLLSYNEQRNKMLSMLVDKDSFRKFKSYQVDLSKIEGDISRLEEKLKSIDKISVLNETTDSLKEILEGLVKDIKSEIASSENKVYPEIRRLFHNIFKYIVNTPAIIFISQNKNNNIDFKVEVTQEDDVITGQKNGNSYYKMLCISFDLSILVAYHKNSFYRFVYHDGALEGLDNRKKENYIKLLRKYCSDFGLQFIITSIEDDIPSELLKTFTEKEICLTLNDSGDEGKLFEFSF